MKRIILALTIAATFTASLPAAPMGTAFTYQGKLHDGSAPANGFYDFDFKLYPGANIGPQIGATFSQSFVPVSNGLFTVKLDFGAQFNGDTRWLEIWANTNGLPVALLSPRQELTPTPYALFAATAATVTNQAITTLQLAPGAVTAPQIGTLSPPVNGQVLSYTSTGLVWTTTSSPLAWLLNGNGGTISNNFLGTTDNQSLNIKVNNERAFRFEPDNQSPRLIGGHAANVISLGSGGVIAGGGSSFNPNLLGARYGFVGGGAGNTNLTPFGVLSGGFQNRVEGPFDNSVGGGSYNYANGTANVITGGTLNTNRVGFYGTIGGGALNLVQSPYSATVAGGYQNTVYGQDATIGGGSYNTGEADISVIAGGQDNYIGTNIFDLGEFGVLTNYGSYSSILGGSDNRISSIYSSVAGGANNLVYGDYSQIGGGSGNKVGDPSSSSSSFGYNTIAGGLQNLVIGLGATIAGGGGNTASGLWSSALGGHFNTATGEVSVAVGQQAVGRLFGQLAHSAGRFASDGDAQSSEYVLRGTTINGGPGSLSLDGSGRWLTIPVGATLQFDIQVTARNAAGDSAGFRINGVIKNVAGTTSFVGSPTADHTWRDPGASTWTASVSAADVDDTLQVFVGSGLPANPIRWVATVRTTEVKF